MAKRKYSKNSDIITGCQRDIYTIYTDGSSCDFIENRPSGAAFVIIDYRTDEKMREWSKGYTRITSNQAELIAIIESLRVLPNRCRIIIYTDSKYSISVLDHTSGDFPKNMNYISEFRTIIEEKELNYTFKWVHSHSKNKMNNHVDKLAYEAYLSVGGERINWHSKRCIKEKVNKY